MAVPTITRSYATRNPRLKNGMLHYSMLPSIRTLETKTQFLRCPFQFSVNEGFRMKAEHFSFKMKVLAI